MDTVNRVAQEVNVRKCAAADRTRPEFECDSGYRNVAVKMTVLLTLDRRPGHGRPVADDVVIYGSGTTRTPAREIIAEVGPNERQPCLHLYIGCSTR